MEAGSMQDKAIQAYTKGIATYVAIVVRNAMEDFHREHLSDKQMAELNPIIRNAIFTALYARETVTLLPRSKQFVDSQVVHIPAYWEEPEFLAGFLPGTGQAQGMGTEG